MNAKLRKIIAEVLSIAEEKVDSSTSAKTEPQWDSLRHMNLIFAIEDTFGIRFTDDEIPLLISVAAIEQALAARK